VPGLFEFDLYVPDEPRYSVVEKSPDQADNETEYPIEDGQENHGPNAEQQAGEGTRSLGVRRSNGRTKQRVMGKSTPTMSPSKAYRTPSTLPSESTPTLLTTMRDLPNSFGSHTTRSRYQTLSKLQSRRDR
jgi:hypothetical protein